MAASSTGRRNTGVKFLCRGFKSQGLAWPLIELAGHFVEMGLRVHRQVGSFRKILSQQAIGVLVGTALPWTLRIAKVNMEVGRYRKEWMLGGLVAGAPGQALVESIRSHLGRFDQRGNDGMRVIVD